MEGMQKTLNQMMATFTERLDTLEDKLPTATSSGSPSSVAADIASLKSFVISTFRALQAQISLIAQQVDQSEMRARRKILLIHGIPEVTSENTPAVVAKAVVEQMKLSGFKVADIKRCHRMGRAVENKPRPILFKLSDAALRDKIWASKSSLKGSGITVSEFLTKTRHDVFLAARQRFGINKCWTREGNIYILDPEGVRHRVTSMEELTLISQPNLVASATPKPTPVKAKDGAKAAVKGKKAAATKKK